MVTVKPTISNVLGQAFVSVLEEKACYLDADHIRWQIEDGKWIGKRAVYTTDRRAVWLENTAPENVKLWWHGKDADYSEEFYRGN